MYNEFEFLIVYLNRLLNLYEIEKLHHFLFDCTKLQIDLPHWLSMKYLKDNLIT